MQRNFIRETVPAGHADIKSYESELIHSGSPRPQLAIAAAGPSFAVDSAEEEELIHFRVNVTGNLWYATTSRLDALGKEAHDLFEGVMVIFAAMTKALAEEGKGLFDFHDWSKLLHKSGFFVQSDTLVKPLAIHANTLPVSSQILTQLLPGIDKSQMATAIGQEVLSAMSGEYANNQHKEGASVGHLLFVCEEVFGTPAVSVRLFSADGNQMRKMLQSPCPRTSSVSYEVDQRIDVFRFLSPAQISQFEKTFKEDADGYLSLVESLKKSLRDY